MQCLSTKKQANTFKSKIILLFSEQCCDESHFTDCTRCSPQTTCYDGKCWTTITFARVNAKPTTTTPPLTTLQPCNENKDCPEGSKCEDDVCIQDYWKKVIKENKLLNEYIAIKKKRFIALFFVKLIIKQLRLLFFV